MTTAKITQQTGPLIRFSLCKLCVYLLKLLSLEDTKKQVSASVMNQVHESQLQPEGLH